MKFTERFKTEIYSAVLNTAIRISGAERPVPDSDEGAHRPSRDFKYNESYYFNFFDDTKMTGGFVWIGKLPNQKKVNATQLIYTANECYARFVSDEYPVHSDSIFCGNMRYEIIEPFKKVHIVSTGKALRMKNPARITDSESAFAAAKDRYLVDIELDCVFTALSPAHNSRNLYARGVAKQMTEKGFGLKDLASIKKIASSHYEQSGEYTGTLKIGKKKTVLNCQGHRDHSWGIRDWVAPERWTWLSAEFGRDTGLNLCRIVIDRVDMFFGYIIHNGENYPLINYKLETEFESDGHTQKIIRFSIEDTSGFVMDVSGKAINVIRLVKAENGKSVIINEAMTEYRWGNRRCLGISEYLTNNSL